MTRFVLLVASARGDGWIGRWSPAIGDPTPVGWFLTLAYFAAALSCWAAVRRAELTRRRATMLEREWLLWRASTALLVALGLNKQLDLQRAFTEIVRVASRSGGWYRERRDVQFVFIAVLALCALGTGVAALWATRRASAPTRLAAAGSAALLAFVVARALSFQLVDVAIAQEWIGLRVGSLVESLALATLIAAARWQRRSLSGA